MKTGQMKTIVIPGSPVGTPFQEGVLIGIEAVFRHLSVIAPIPYRESPLLLNQFNAGVEMGYRIARLTEVMEG